MIRKYDLKRMLAEIEEDEEISRKQHQQLSQLEIRELVAKKRRKTRVSRGDKKG